MAGDWIKWTKGLSRRAEVLSMAHVLNLDRRVVACACMELWEWADTETVDGHVRGATPAFIDGLVAVPGFAGAIEAVGWLRSTDQGVTLTGWDKHNGESAKKRAQDVDRQRRSRLKQGQSESVTDPSRSKRDTERDGSATREEKRREEITTTTTARASGPPIQATVIDTCERLLRRKLAPHRNELRKVLEWIERVVDPLNPPTIKGEVWTVERFIAEVFKHVEEANPNDSISQIVNLAEAVIDRCVRQQLLPGERAALNNTPTSKTLDYSKL